MLIRFRLPLAVVLGLSLLVVGCGKYSYSSLKAKKAFRDAASKAKPIVLEPIVNLELVVPSDSVGNVTGDLSGRRGQVAGSQTLPNGMMTIKATAPLAELSDYAGKLKSLTGGHGSYTLEFSHYQAVPFNIQQALAQEFRPKEEED